MMIMLWIRLDNMVNLVCPIVCNTGIVLIKLWTGIVKINV